MLRIIYFGILFLISQHNYAAVIETCSQGVNFNNGNTYATISGKVSCYLRDKPSIKTREVELKDGKQHGKTILYDASLAIISEEDKTGALYRIENYHLGKLEGEVKHYDPRTGTLEELMQFHNDKKTYSKNMKNNEETFYGFGLSGHQVFQSGFFIKKADGKLLRLNCLLFKTDNKMLNRFCGFSENPGPELTFFLEDTRSKKRFCKGVQCGDSSVTSSSGDKISETFVNKQDQKISRKYSENGVLIYELIRNKGEEESSEEREFFDNGSQKSITVFANRQINELTLFYQNGQKKFHGKIQGELVNAVQYFDNGFKREEYQLKSYPGVIRNKYISRSKLINNSKQYYESGELFKEITWKDYHKSRMRVFDKKGLLEKDESYYPDGSRMN